jgi:hypothetical protein
MLCTSFSYSIPLSGIGTTCFSSCCDKIRQLFLRPVATGDLTTANAAPTND